jgi:RNA polymerase sigma-70 factor (ECF subfamily)
VPEDVVTSGVEAPVSLIDTRRGVTPGVSGVHFSPSASRLMNTNPRPKLEPLGTWPNDEHSVSDEVLVARTAAGDRNSYRNLVEKYQGKLLSLAFEILKSQEDAEDVVQEAFVKAFLSLNSFKGQSSFYTWIYRITYNMAIDVKRRAARRGGTHVEFTEGPSVTTPRADGQPRGATVVSEHAQNIEGPADALHRKETGSKLLEVLNQLSPEHRVIMVLREVDGLNYEEISEATGVPKGTVMSRLHYARKALQKALKEFAPPGYDASSAERE